MDSYVHRCMIVPVGALADMAKLLCKGLAPGESGSGMFIKGLSANGLKPASELISVGMITPEFASLLPLTSFDAEGTPTTIPGQPETIVELAQGAVTLAQAKALLNAIDVTEQEPFSALARKGLKLIQGEI